MVSTPPAKKPGNFQHPAILIVANLIAALWIGFCLVSIQQSLGWQAALSLPLTDLGRMLFGVVSVPGMIWMALGYFSGLRRLERANRIMARHFRDFTKFSGTERQQIVHSSETARRESLALFEAAQAALSALNQIRDSLKQNTLALVEAAGQSMHAVDGAGRTMMERSTAVRELSNEIHITAKALETVLARIDHRQLETSGHAIEHIVDRLQSAGEKLADGMRSIDSVASISQDSAGRLEQAAEQIHVSLDSIRNNVSETAGSIDRYAEIGDRIRHYRYETQESLTSIGQVALGVIDVLGRIRSEQEAANRELNYFGDQGQGLSQRLESVRLAAIAGVSDLEGAVDRLQQRSAVLNDELRGSAGSLGESVATLMQDAFGNLNQKSSEINFVVSTAVNRLGELARELQTARSTIDDTTSGASDKMTAIAGSMRAEFGGIHEVADRALEQLQRTLTSVAATSANLDNETQTLEQRITATFLAAETGSAQFNKQMSDALEQIGRAEQIFADGQARIAGTADDSSRHLLQLTASLAHGGAELGKTALVTGERIAAASGIVETRMQSINEVADQVRSAVSAFATELGDMSGQSQSITQALSDRSAVLRDNVRQIGVSAEEAAQSLKVTTDLLLNTSVEISDAAGKTRTEIVRTMAELKREGATIAETEAQSRALTGQVSAMLGERAMELAQTARKLAGETTAMRDMHGKFQRDAFLTAANTVLHALTSLSVDIAHVLETDLPEDLRLELVRGDIPGFVRRLAAMRNDVSTPKLRAKFATDARFRSHVQTYLGQYEDLMKQAAKVDQGAVLSATLVSSDIGKIYTFLSAAISTERDTARDTG